MEASKSNLEASFIKCVSNADDQVDGARLLLEGGNFRLAYSNSILALEEYGKALMLHSCADMGRWDEDIFKALACHKTKQAMGTVLVNYMDWFMEQNQFRIWLNVEAGQAVQLDIGPPVEFDRWIDQARKEIKRGKVERSKQRALYVDISRDGRVQSVPSISEAIADEAFKRAEKAKEAMGHLLLNYRLGPEVKKNFDLESSIRLGLLFW
ncbi:AbiV family abortive infection protein [Aquilutibacter rugosus]|uniref:AbiV family abortive infection protein n=1 Tax=Aquilutibacter rugosus TaxID=3115820 RepID=UPI002F405CD0